MSGRDELRAPAPPIGSTAASSTQACDPSPDFLASIVDSAPFAILVVGRNGGIVFASRGAEQLFGYARAALLEMNIDALVPPAHRAAHCAAHETYLIAPTQRPMGNGLALCALRSDGSEVPVEVALKPIPWASASGVLAIVVDVTERRSLEESVRRARDELELRIQERTAELACMNAKAQHLLQDLEVKTRELERLSLQDPLTGLSNRRDFDRHLDMWMRQAQRQSSPLSIAIFDIDLFKQVNDRFGHAQGDEVLKETANLMRRECRAIDVVARYGGEEFALIFPNVDTSGALAICERIRDAFARFDWSACAPGLTLTISAGIATWRQILSAAQLLELADRRLYRAKRCGRNRVVCDDAV